MKKAILFVAFAVMLGAGAAMAADDLVPNPLATAKIGEWAQYKVPNDYIQKLTVISREGEGPDAMVTVRIDDIYDGEVVATREISQDAGEPMSPPRLPDDPGIKVTIEKKDAVVKGATLAATVVLVDKEYEGEDAEKSEWWVASEIPVFGIIKKVTDGETVFEILDYGAQ